jgi:hypothetical protein
MEKVVKPSYDQIKKKGEIDELKIWLENSI